MLTSCGLLVPMFYLFSIQIAEQKYNQEIGDFISYSSFLSLKKYVLWCINVVS